MTGQKLCDENRCLCKGMRGSFFPIYCSPILAWEELRFRRGMFPAFPLDTLTGCRGGPYAEIGVTLRV